MMVSRAGRRVLDAYLQLFIHSCPETLPPSLDLEATMETALNTYVLGEHVASAWNLYPIVLWTPTLPSSKKTSRAETEVEAQRDAEKGLIDGFDLRTLKTSGLYKVHGEAVQAIIGGVYHQFVSAANLDGLMSWVAKLVLSDREAPLPNASSTPASSHIFSSLGERPVWQIRYMLRPCEPT